MSVLNQITTTREIEKNARNSIKKPIQLIITPPLLQLLCWAFWKTQEEVPEALHEHDCIEQNIHHTTDTEKRKKFNKQNHSTIRYQENLW